MSSYVVVRSIVYYDVLSIIVITYYCVLSCITHDYLLLLSTVSRIFLFIIIFINHLLSLFINLSSFIVMFPLLFFMWYLLCITYYCHLSIYLNLPATSHDKNLSNSGVAPNCCKLQLV